MWWNMVSSKRTSQKMLILYSNSSHNITFVKKCLIETIVTCIYYMIIIMMQMSWSMRNYNYNMHTCTQLHERECQGNLMIKEPSFKFTETFRESCSIQSLRNKDARWVSVESVNIYVTRFAKTRHNDAFLEIQIFASVSSI